MNPNAVSAIVGSILFLLLSHVILKNLLNERIFDIPFIQKQKRKKETFHNVENELKDYLEDSFPVKEHNYYQGNQHPNQMFSEETDISDFFERPVRKRFTGKKDTLTNLPMFDSPTGDEYHRTFKPDMWKYDNEKIMNGGDFDGVYGYDDQWDSLAMYE